MTLKPAVQHRKSSFSTAGSYRIPMPVREILELPNGYRAAVNRKGAGDGVHQRRFSCAVSADDCNEISIIKMQGYVYKRDFFGDSAGIEGFGYMYYVQHYFAASFHCFALYFACKSGRPSAIATRMAVKSFRSFGGMPSSSTRAITIR